MVSLADQIKPKKAVFTWLVKERKTGTPIINSILSILAKKPPSDLHVDNPCEDAASKGWLLSF